MLPSVVGCSDRSLCCAHPGPRPLVGAAFLCGSGGCVLANPVDQGLFQPGIVLTAVGVLVLREGVVSRTVAEPCAVRVRGWRAVASLRLVGDVRPDVAGGD